MKSRVILIILLTLFAGRTWSHEMRPAYLEIKQVTPDSYDVLWKIPVRGDLRLQLEPQFPDMCSATIAAASHRVAGAMVSRWSILCTGSLTDQKIDIAGLENTFTDVLARVQHLNGAVQTTRIQPGEPSFTVTGSPSKLALSGTYLLLGIEHILLGIDHLLFVFALLILVSGVRRLVWTITTFTVAHSITLAGATLGYVHVPQQPVEAIIALSILLLATEIVHSHRGRPGYAERWPWGIAFVFGLLHGFGFAGALAEVGLPEHAIPFALVFFNVGVELGQLVFIAAVLLSGWLIHRIKAFPLRSAEMVSSYVIGSVAAYWTIERVAGFWV